MFEFAFNIGEEVEIRSNTTPHAGHKYRVYRIRGHSYQLIDENEFTTVNWYNERDLINNRKNRL